MSADNWAVCPWCELRNQGEIDKLRGQLDSKYGKVPAEQFIAERAAFLDRESKPMETSLREDYYIGVSVDGFFEVTYDGACTCGFKHKFHQKDAIPAPPCQDAKANSAPVRRSLK